MMVAVPFVYLVVTVVGAVGVLLAYRPFAVSR